ncbi:MAG: acetate--CoA ligase family protein [Desulfobulbus sp.]|jgi:acetyltransferase|uniref:acetate--CoA ligase family protein n=1 Tax=Desulfobulbus sp. TaxID=895 RepID=UPI00283E5ECE|nr:acetate--CoA ligase family protein [Desulfobulbus sp.]MDR2551097.1 acetate--CoA ligase family protein [Desulfobulbus sp.]
MDTFFAPASLAVYGLSSKARNTPRIIVGNCLRWGYRGRIFGVNPATDETDVDGIRVYRSAADLPLIPDLAVLLIPARFVPEAVADCGRAGIRQLAIQAGGFNEASEEGRALATRLLALARSHGMRFVGPNSLALADTASGLCLPFVPSFPVRPGGFSLITQSGGLGLFLWNLLEAEQVGLAKFASIGNKLDLDECDLLEYLGADPATKVIGIYLESIGNGRRLVELAERIDKPVLFYKANTTRAGGLAAMSHTAALSTDDAILDAALERAGILRIDRLRDFVTTAKAFDLPPMRGNRIMLMSPAGGLGVAMADLCEHRGLSCADPGPAFFEELAGVARADIIRLQNPLDMGDIYRVDKYPLIFSHVLANDRVDAAIFASQRPSMPAGGEDVFTGMFTTDPSLAVAGAVRSSGKPMALVMYGAAREVAAMKAQSPVPVFDGPEEAIAALDRQMRYHVRKAAGPFRPDPGDEGLDPDRIETWLRGRSEVVGEETLELLACCGLAGPASAVARTAEEAAELAARIGPPVVLKVVSPEAVHKTEAGGVLVDIASAAEAARGFDRIRTNLMRHHPGARFDGVRVAAMAPAGHDLFIGGLQDPAFGPVVLFGHGGIFVEVFQDVQRILAPSSLAEITGKIKQLRSAALLAGVRGQPPVDPAPFARAILAVARLLAEFPQIAELDVNPFRLLDRGGALALDARLRLDTGRQ